MVAVGNSDVGFATRNRATSLRRDRLSTHPRSLPPYVEGLLQEFASPSDRRASRALGVGGLVAPGSYHRE